MDDDFDYSAGLAFDTPIGTIAEFEPSVDLRYPPSLHHVLFAWTDEEEDLQLAALGWFLLWRKANSFILGGDDGHFALPISDPGLWLALKVRILDWAWAEKGGLDLGRTYTLLLERHHLRIKESPIRNAKQFPAMCGDNPKEQHHHVRVIKQGPIDRIRRERPRIEDAAERDGPNLFPDGHN